MPRHARSTARERAASLVGLDGGVEAPPAPSGLLPAQRSSWATFWESPLAKIVVPATDLPGLTRLWQLYDERARCYRELRRSRLVAGSRGQPRRSPLYDVMATLDSEIRQLEDRFGLSPRARLRLQVVLGDATRSLDDLNADLEADEGDGPDPRLLVVDGRTR